MPSFRTWSTSTMAVSSPITVFTSVQLLMARNLVPQFPGGGEAFLGGPEVFFKAIQVAGQVSLSARFP